MVAISARRVADQTRQQVNEQIRRQTEMNIAHFTAHPDQIDRRLAELDQEWDIERTMETWSSGLTMFGLTMTLLHGRRWLILPFFVQGMFMNHALQGWCPPVPVLRKLGFRTVEEIDEERYALKAIRGDFQNVGNGSGEPDAQRATRALEAARSSQRVNLAQQGA